MGGGGKGGGNKEAKRAREEEEARQARIREGTERINTIFDGAKGPDGTRTGGNFGEPFYGRQKDAYLGYATPQLEDQYGKAQEDLTFSLARNGTLDSSTRGAKLGELQKLYDLNKQQVADQALGYETTARNSVEDARGNLISTLNATGDAEGAASAALARSQALSKPPVYSPLGQLFAQFTAGLGQQAASERAEAESYNPVNGQFGFNANYNTGLFGSRGRVTNIR